MFYVPHFLNQAPSFSLIFIIISKDQHLGLPGPTKIKTAQKRIPYIHSSPFISRFYVLIHSPGHYHCTIIQIRLFSAYSVAENVLLAIDFCLLLFPIPKFSFKEKCLAQWSGCCSGHLHPCLGACVRVLFLALLIHASC